MSGLNRRAGTGMVQLCLALLTCLPLSVVTGCGNDGTSSIGIPEPPPQTEPAITGVILAPNGQFASADRWWRWPDRLRLVPPAYALQNVSPAEGVINVALSRVDYVDAADGRIDTAHLLSQVRTEGDGIYKIVDPVAKNVDDCRLMVAVGGGRSLTRAFVFSHTTNIDAVSEAVVRVVLDRLTKAPPVQLCNFTSDGLMQIADQAWIAAFTTTGDTVAEINQNAFERVAAFRGVKQAIDAATGVPVSEP